MGSVEPWPSANFVLFRLKVPWKLCRVHALNEEREEGGVVVVDQRYTVAEGILVLLLIHLQIWDSTSSYAPF